MSRILRIIGEERQPFAGHRRNITHQLRLVRCDFHRGDFTDQTLFCAFRKRRDGTDFFAARFVY